MDICLAAPRAFPCHVCEGLGDKDESELTVKGVGWGCKGGDTMFTVKGHREITENFPLLGTGSQAAWEAGVALET